MVVVTVTRSGRTIKKPDLYQPAEEVLEDDYADDEHDSDMGSVDDESESKEEDA